MTHFPGFWSYVHDDDDAESGRISRLAKDVVNQYEMITGDKIALFLDKVAIAWGDNWRDKIDMSLESTAFFIPVITPRYFMSPECRRELGDFIRSATRLGIKELILPLYYVTVPAIETRSNPDELITTVCTFQWEDWRQLRFKGLRSEEYRLGVFRLATRLAEANKRAEEAIVIIEKEQTQNVGNKEELGFLDKLAAWEDAMPKMTSTMTFISSAVEKIGLIMNDSTDEIRRADNQGKGFSGRIYVVRKTAKDLNDPVNVILEKSNEFVELVHNFDDGFRVFIKHAPAEIKEKPENKKTICEFIQVMNNLVVIWYSSMSAIESMREKIDPLEQASRDLRPVMRQLRHGLTTLIESNSIISEWTKLMKEVNLECGELAV